MKCSVCFKPLRSQSGICPWCSYAARDLTAPVPKTFAEVIRTPSYQAFAEMLRRHDALDTEELQMKLYSDARARRHLRELLKTLYRRLCHQLKATTLRDQTRFILEERKRSLLLRIHQLKERK